jgi:predicted metal-dependent HD superfamily phosphohydrolase
MAAASQVITRTGAAVRPEDDEYGDVLKHVDMAIYTANRAGRENYRRQVRAPDGLASIDRWGGTLRKCHTNTTPSRQAYHYHLIIFLTDHSPQ